MRAENVLASPVWVLVHLVALVIARARGNMSVVSVVLCSDRDGDHVQTAIVTGRWCLLGKSESPDYAQRFELVRLNARRIRRGVVYGRHRRILYTFEFRAGVASSLFFCERGINGSPEAHLLVTRECIWCAAGPEGYDN